MDWKKERYINSRFLIMFMGGLIFLIFVINLFLSYGLTVGFISGAVLLFGIIPTFSYINKQYKSDYKTIDKTIQPRNQKQSKIDKGLSYGIYAIGIIIALIIAFVLLMIMRTS